MDHLPIPDFFDPSKVKDVFRVPYEERAQAAREWAQLHGLKPAFEDETRNLLLLIDVQNTFCLPDFELYVAGRSGTGAVDDSQRLCEFIYRNIDSLSQIVATMDTHQVMQIFHAIFLVDESGLHPEPYTNVSVKDIRSSRWRFNPVLSDHFGISPEYGQKRLESYVAALEAQGKYSLTIWPYHAMLGGVGHALVSSVEEAIFFHSIARLSQPIFEIKGDRPFTEYYSAIGPEVDKGPKGETLGEHNQYFLEMLRQVDKFIVAGQAKSHCVASTVADLLKDLQAADLGLAEKIYLLEDCTSPVVVPGADFTEAADSAYAGFAQAGMHIVKSTDPIFA